MTFAEYTALEAENFSALKHILTSPAHYKAAKIAEREETIDMRLGTAVHEVVLEGRIRPFVIRPDFDPAKPGEPWHGGRTSCKAWLASQSLPVYTREENERRLRMSEALLRSELFQMLMAACPEREKVVLATYQGVPMKARLDAVGTWEGRRMIVDLKKTPDASPRAWGKKCYQMHYDLQLVAYSTLLAIQEEAGEPPFVVHAVVEDSDAAPVVLYSLPAEAWESGQRKLDRAISTLKACRESDLWPGYSDETIIAPEWPRYAKDDSL